MSDEVISSSSIPVEASPTKPLAIVVDDPEGTPKTRLVDLNDQFAPLPESFLMPSTLFANTGGSAALSNYSSGVYRWNVWTLSPTTTEAVSVSGVRFPESWTTCNVNVWTALTSADGGGNAVLRIDYAHITAAGQSLGSNGADSAETAVDPGGNITPASNTLLADFAVDPDGIYSFRVVRLGADVADTLAQDIGFLWLEFVKTA